MSEEITAAIIKEHNLNEEEYAKILNFLGRQPTMTELGIYSAMWSEHCSYKSTRKWLKTLPTKAPWVVCGPGENAGVIDIGDGKVAVFKMESHNHPSFIEPFHGAATGVGGILRDVFTMGARPVANLNSLRFGEVNHKKTPRLLEGVVSGISFYGNCIGVPTVGGECSFHESYNGNNLVNAMTVGIADADKIFYSAASNVGALVAYVGSKTGKDGVKGAVMASDEFNSNDSDKRPSVQVGDPFTEKLLLEACLELMEQKCVLSIQDMGAAGLTSSAAEMAGKGNTGIELDLDKVPLRQENMTAYEIMLSESQERMLMIIDEKKKDQAKAIFKKWQLDFAIIGEVTDSKYLLVKRNGKIEANIPIESLGESAPVYEREYKKTKKRSPLGVVRSDSLWMDNLITILANPNIASKEWIYSQYDRHVMNDTITSCSGGASLIRIHKTNKALAVTSNCNPRYVSVNPAEGAKQAVVESYRNIISVGAKPLAITNCLNFGNPEKPEIMGQIVEAISGIKEACEKLEYPVVSGNVSLYNETDGKAIQPTPTIGGVGILEDIKLKMDCSFKDEGDLLFVIGKTEGHLGASVFAHEILNITKYGDAPKIDLTTEKKTAHLITDLIHKKIINSCMDIGNGGMLVTMAKMAIAGQIGVTINWHHLMKENKNLKDFEILFSEDQARYLITINKNKLEKLFNEALKAKIIICEIGVVGGKYISIEKSKVALKKITEVYKESFVEKILN